MTRGPHASSSVIADGRGVRESPGTQTALPFCLDLAGLPGTAGPGSFPIRAPHAPHAEKCAASQFSQVPATVSAAESTSGTGHKARHLQMEAAGSQQETGAQQAKRAGTTEAGRPVSSRPYTRLPLPGTIPGTLRARGRHGAR